MKALSPRWVAAAALFAAGWAQADVQVGYQEPQQFTEFTYGAARFDSPRSQAWLEELQKYVQQRAARVVPVGDTLVVTITDVRRAGRADVGRFPTAPDLRVVHDIDSPRIDLRFTLTRADGSVAAQGERALRDLDFLRGAPLRHEGDTLRFEKNLIDDWLGREFAAGAG